MADAARGFSMIDSPAADSAGDGSETVGAALRRAREKRGLSLAQVGAALCLKENVLRALESRQYSALPKVPYCFGFVRTYARYLDLDSEEMVRRFKNEIGDLPPAARLHPPAPLRGGRVPLRGILTVSLVLAAAVYGGWSFYMGGDAPRPALTAAAPAAPAPTAPVKSATADPDAAAPGSADPAAPNTAAASPEGQPAQAPAAGEAAPDARKSPPHETTSAAPADPRLAPAKPGEAKPAEAKPTAPVPAPAPANVIVLRALGNVWVMVHDGRGHTALQKVMQKGEEFRITDRQDLILHSGAPAYVQIELDGRVLKPIPSNSRQGLKQALDPKALAKLP